MDRNENDGLLFLSACFLANSWKKPWSLVFPGFRFKNKMEISQELKKFFQMFYLQKQAGQEKTRIFLSPHLNFLEKGPL